MIRMKIKTTVLHYTKPTSDVFLTDVTRQTEHLIVDSKMEDGIAIIHTDHPNCCITTMEYEPGSIHDMQEALKKLNPHNGHNGHHEGNSGNGANGNGTHQDVRTTLIGTSITVPFKDNRELLGKWQKVVLVDFDASKEEKRVIVQVIGE
jgi:secondary thiamine-phosphate synthase enzyme